MRVTVKILGLVFVLLLATTNQAWGQTITPAAIIAEVNHARAENNLKPYTISLPLILASLRKGIDMYTLGYLSHVSPRGLYPWDFVKGVGYKYQSVGENLGFSYTDEVALVNAMLNSPSHRANLLSKEHTEIGVGVVPHPTLLGETVGVMLFASPQK